MILLHRHETSERFLRGVTVEHVNAAVGSCENLCTEGALDSRCEATSMSSSFGSFSISQNGYIYACMLSRDFMKLSL